MDAWSHVVRIKKTIKYEEANFLPELSPHGQNKYFKVLDLYIIMMACIPTGLMYLSDSL